MKTMISQPLKGLSRVEIVSKRNKCKEYLENKGYIVVDSIINEDANNPLSSLASSIKCMSSCDTVYFCNGWEYARGCIIEHMCARYYGLKILYESEVDQ